MLIKYEQRTVIINMNMSHLTPTNSDKKKWTIINDKQLIQLNEKLKLGRLTLKEYMLDAANRVRPNFEVEVEEAIDVGREEAMAVALNEVQDDDMYAVQIVVDDAREDTFQNIFHELASCGYIAAKAVFLLNNAGTDWWKTKIIDDLLEEDLVFSGNYFLGYKNPAKAICIEGWDIMRLVGNHCNETGRDETLMHTSNDLALADLSNLLTMQEFIQKRDFLITYLVINNIRRSLEMCSFTLKEFADAKRDKDGEGFAICIKYHKTRSNGKSYNCK